MKKYSEHIHENKEEKITLQIEISNLDASFAQEFKNLLFAMDLAGNLGCSREFKVFVDGDGAFRPIVKIDGVDKKNFEFGSNVNFDKDKLTFSFD